MLYRVFHCCLNKAVASQIFPVLFLFGDWKIVNIFLCSKMAKSCLRWWNRWSFVWKQMTKLRLSRLFKQERRKFNFNLFLNRSQIFKLVKNFDAHRTCKSRRCSSPSVRLITIRTSERKGHVLSITLHGAFNRAFNGKADMWSMYFRLSLDNFGSCLRLDFCKSSNVIFSHFNKFNYHNFILCCPWFMPNHFISKFVKCPILLKTNHRLTSILQRLLWILLLQRLREYKPKIPLIMTRPLTSYRCVKKGPTNS